MTTQRLEIPRWECIDLLRSQQVGRLCIIEDDFPLALPVNYRVAGADLTTSIVVRTAPNTVIGQYHGKSSLEVDVVDTTRRSAWSVIVRGTFHHVAGEHSLPDPEPWLTVDRHHWMVLEPQAISGRRFNAVLGDDGYSVDWAITTG